SEWKSPANGFREADHVRLHAEVVAGSAPGELGAGFYLVKNQQRAIGVTQFSKAFEKAGLRQAEADVHQDRFENDCGDLARILLKAVFHALQIVEGSNEYVIHRGLGNAAAAGNGIGRVDVAVLIFLRLYADERGVVQAVVGAFKLDDFV